MNPDTLNKLTPGSRETLKTVQGIARRAPSICHGKMVPLILELTALISDLENTLEAQTEELGDALVRVEELELRARIAELLNVWQTTGDGPYRET